MRGYRISESDPIDVHVGSRLRMRRNFLRMSQTDVAEILGLTFQQIQKYERGANRISSSKLFKLSILLDVPIVYFFEGMSDQVERNLRSSNSENSEMFDQNQFANRETLELVQNYFKISNPKVRKRIFEFIKGISQFEK